MAFPCLASAAVGANLIHYVGSWLDHGSLASPAFMVLVNEILYMVNQFMGGVPVSEETLALDMMNRVGLGRALPQRRSHAPALQGDVVLGFFDRSIYQTLPGSRWQEIRRAAAEQDDQADEASAQAAARRCEP